VKKCCDEDVLFLGVKLGKCVRGTCNIRKRYNSNEWSVKKSLNKRR